MKTYYSFHDTSHYDAADFEVCMCPECGDEGTGGETCRHCGHHEYMGYSDWTEQDVRDMYEKAQINEREYDLIRALRPHASTGDEAVIYDGINGEWGPVAIFRKFLND